MKLKTEKALMEGIVARSIEPNRVGLGVWAFRSNDDPTRLVIAPHGTENWETVDWQVVARGVWRCTGGQGERPTGFTKPMHEQLSLALSDLDPELMDPKTASAVIQVGLYQEVRFR